MLLWTHKREWVSVCLILFQTVSLLGKLFFLPIYLLFYYFHNDDWVCLLAGSNWDFLNLLFWADIGDISLYAEERGLIYPALVIVFSLFSVADTSCLLMCFRSQSYLSPHPLYFLITLLHYLKQMHAFKYKEDICWRKAVVENINMLTTLWKFFFTKNVFGLYHSKT